MNGGPSASTEGPPLLPLLRERLEDLAARLGVPSPHPGALVAVLVVLCVAVAWAALRFGGGTPTEVADDAFVSAEAPPETTRSTAPTGPAEVVVHVAGAVRRPGVYRLPGGSRGDDALRAAGGTLGNADAGAINLARVLADGEQLVVPVKGGGGGAMPAGSGGGAAGAAEAGGAPPAGKVSLNAASAAQLDALPGIGPATAAKIVTDREKNGPFTTVDDLARVPGIGPKKVEGLKDLVTVP